MALISLLTYCSLAVTGNRHRSSISCCYGLVERCRGRMWSDSKWRLMAELFSEGDHGMNSKRFCLKMGYVMVMVIGQDPNPVGESWRCMVCGRWLAATCVEDQC